ncbi:MULTISPECIES: hypothetical protein [unclassified Brucella]|uniref:hypothetical protein n=1 Tax=unclassified Brucella TaxID=2632610 RepID=UPI00217F1584|nr:MULTISPECIES: hypothetical protein [unclassified Brucella]UWF67385.1 hypothetical protein NYO63_04390 [Brucella sp. 1315]UWF70510.1 hypothetical protein NYO65_04390 [Brucella sp. 2594]
MKQVFCTFLRKVYVDTEMTGSAVGSITAFVDHVIRVLTALGFLTGLIQLRERYPDNDVLLVLLIVLTLTMLYYIIFIVNHLVIKMGQTLSFSVNARRVAGLVTKLTICVLFIEFHTIIASYLAEVKPFGCG